MSASLFDSKIGMLLPHVCPTSFPELVLSYLSACLSLFGCLFKWV